MSASASRLEAGFVLGWETKPRTYNQASTQVIAYSAEPNNGHPSLSAATTPSTRDAARHASRARPPNLRTVQVIRKVSPKWSRDRASKRKPAISLRSSPRSWKGSGLYLPATSTRCCCLRCGTGHAACSDGLRYSRVGCHVAAPRRPDERPQRGRSDAEGPPDRSRSVLERSAQVEPHKIESRYRRQLTAVFVRVHSVVVKLGTGTNSVPVRLVDLGFPRRPQE